MKESSSLARAAAVFSPVYQSFLSALPVGALALALAACGGGDSKVLGNNVSNNSSQSSSTGNSGWRAGVYKSSAEFKNFCAAPRTGASQHTREPFPDKKGTAIDEKNFLRSWSYETYLWFEELPDLNPDSNRTPQQYFDLLKTNRTTSSGKPKDNFHAYIPTDEAEAGDAGVAYDYGMHLKVDSPYPPRGYYVAFVEPGSPADKQEIKRGAKILEIDSYDLVNETSEAGLIALNEGLFPSRINAAHRFKIQEVGSEPREVTLESAKIDTSPVLLTSVLDTGENKVGYIVFNSHIEKAQNQWIAAINELKQAGVSDVILDLRYNSGGLLSIASQVGYMLGGANVEGKVFLQETQNSKQGKFDPFPFVDFGIYEGYEGLDLPTLDLKRVYILSSNDTCSASETIINGLRGVDFEVYLIGDATCGKPYGFYPEPNCGTTYYTIQIKAANAKGFGEYSDGFTPSSRPVNQTQVQGCFVADDLGYPLGDSREAMLATALSFRENGVCPAASSRRLQKPGTAISSGKLIVPEVRKLLILK